MNHYIITYQVIIDNHQPIVGTTGNVVFSAKHSRDYKPLQVAQYVREEYELQYPDANEIRVRFQYIELVDEQRYEELSDSFTLTQWMCRTA
jgi:hypothetical protein